MLVTILIHSFHSPIAFLITCTAQAMHAGFIEICMGSTKPYPRPFLYTTYSGTDAKNRTLHLLLTHTIQKFKCGNSRSLHSSVLECIVWDPFHSAAIRFSRNGIMFNVYDGPLHNAPLYWFFFLSFFLSCVRQLSTTSPMDYFSYFT